MHLSHTLPTFLLALLPASAALAQSTASTIWFDKPTSLRGAFIWYGGHPERYSESNKPVDAGDTAVNPDSEWERRSLPLGNGSVGCNVMGSVSAERITLNEKTLWRGGPGTGTAATRGTAEGSRAYWNVNAPAANALSDIRAAFAAGDGERAAALTEENFHSNVPYNARGEESFRFGSFTTMGELLVSTGHKDTEVQNYRRALSLDSAVACVSYDIDGTHFERTAFVSYPDNVLVLRFRRSGSGPQTLRLTYSPNPVATGTLTPEGKDGLCYSARLDNNGMQFVVRLRAVAHGGTIKNSDEALTVEGADEVIFFLTADTDYAPNYDPQPDDPMAYVGVDPSCTTADWMKNAAKKGYAALLSRHVADYQGLFRRVSLSLGTDASSAANLPTDQRLQAYRQGGNDAGLETLYYQYGRYLLIASSRAGNLPANLQGIWHNNVDGPWRVDYHNNINLQMNYWPALPTNLTECAEPLTNFIRLLEKPGRATAKAYWGARGWAAGISANIFGFTAPLQDRDMSWNYNPMAASWLATHLWDYYDFTRSEAFLRDTAYTLIASCADFCCDFLWRRPDGSFTAAPSTSPEHGPIDEGTTFTHAVAREILQCALRAAAVLDVDADRRDEWARTLRGIVPYQIGRYGQLLEWSKDIDDPNDHHRHVNHLFGLHPGTTISPLTTPALAEASRVVLTHRGDGATGWSMGWKLCQWARLHDGDHAYRLFRNLLSDGTADNLWDLHPPFQIDGNFGGTAGITEMLLQSHAGCLHLLPSLPAAWKEGHISGLRARGNFDVSISWSNNTLAQATIVSRSGVDLHLRYGNRTLTLPTTAGKTYTVSLANDQLVAEEKN